MAENCMRTSISVSDYHTGIGHRNANLLLVNQIFQFWDVNYHTVTHYIQKPTVFCSHILPSGYQTWQRGNHQFIDDFVPARKLHFKQRSSIAFDFPKALSQGFSKGSQPGSSTSSSHCRIDGNSLGWTIGSTWSNHFGWLCHQLHSIAMSSHIFSLWFISMYLYISRLI